MKPWPIASIRAAAPCGLSSLCLRHQSLNPPFFSYSYWIGLYPSSASLLRLALSVDVVDGHGEEARLDEVDGYFDAARASAMMRSSSSEEVDV